MRVVRSQKCWSSRSNVVRTGPASDDFLSASNMSTKCGASNAPVHRRNRSGSAAAFFSSIGGDASVLAHPREDPLLAFLCRLEIAIWVEPRRRLRKPRQQRRLGKALGRRAASRNRVLRPPPPPSPGCHKRRAGSIPSESAPCSMTSRLPGIRDLPELVPPRAVRVPPLRNLDQLPRDRRRPRNRPPRPERIKPRPPHPNNINPPVRPEPLVLRGNRGVDQRLGTCANVRGSSRWSSSRGNLRIGTPPMSVISAPGSGGRVRASGTERSRGKPVVKHCPHHEQKTKPPEPAARPAR